MPLSKHYGGSGEKVMRSMKEQYGEKKGERVFYATENKMKKKTKQYGSGPFSKADEARGYKVLCDANDLNEMDYDRVENIKPEYMLAKRRESNTGGHKVRHTMRRSESTKGRSY